MSGRSPDAAYKREKPREETEARLLRERGTPEELIGPVVPDGSRYGSDAATTSRVTSMREFLLKRRDFDRLRRLRPWGIGNVVQHPVAIGESRERPGQLRIERGWDGD